MVDNPCDPEELLCHGIVGNIPVEFHSADLRSFFSHFIENHGFDCFHFRHRPEVQISTGRNTEDVTKGKTCCCVVRLSRERMNDFVKTYHGQNWEDRNKKCCPKKAMISRIKVDDHRKTGEDKPDEPQYQTRKERKLNFSGKVAFSRTDLQKLPELHPPAPMMPNGNVGTPTSVFLELIRSCKLPPKIVSKLGVTFPKNSSRKKYGNMPFDYNSLKALNRRRTRAADNGDIEENADGGDNSEQACVAHLNEKGRLVKEISAGQKPSSEGSSNSREASRAMQNEPVTRTSTKTQSNSSNSVDSEIVSAREDSCPSEGSIERRELTTSHAVQGEQILRTVNKHSPSESNLSRTLTKTRSNSSNSVDPEIEKTGTVNIEDPKAGEAFGKRKCRKSRSENPVHSESDGHGEAETESDTEVEDWERHEALHNDVDNQGRTRERLFEEEIELKWEKGGSGLVFYTDAAYWRQQEEADMDEEMADDWDIDMGVYEEPGCGDKDSRDLLQMRTEEQWRRGNEIDPNRIGGFEKFTKGFGGRMMRQQGWREGKGLGSSQVGIAEPVSAEGQTPYSKRGLGYFGEKLERNVQVKRPRADRDIKISTIYDEPDGRDINLFQSQGPYVLTYRDNVEFVPAKEVKERKLK